MKIYIGKNKKNAKLIKFRDLLANKLELAKYQVNNDKFNDNSCSWVEINKTSKITYPNGDKLCISVVIAFVEDTDEIDEVEVYATPIVTMKDEDNTKKLI